MSERLTTVSLPVADCDHPGLSEWGVVPVDDAIERYRRYAKAQKRWAEKVLAADESAFRVYTHTGRIVERNVCVLQEGASDE